MHARGGEDERRLALQVHAVAADAALEDQRRRHRGAAREGVRGGGDVALEVRGRGEGGKADEERREEQRRAHPSRQSTARATSPPAPRRSVEVTAAAAPRSRTCADTCVPHTST